MVLNLFGCWVIVLAITVTGLEFGWNSHRFRQPGSSGEGWDGETRGLVGTPLSKGL